MCCSQNEFARMKNEGLIWPYVDRLHQLHRLVERIYHFAGVIPKDQELVPEPNVHTGGLDLLILNGIDDELSVTE